ncbi:isovaleryl-homoserine lactone synthase [Tsuneonella deserti]|uniref:Acyl-homoserine-lactone synthase n=1 Tax=Tsuneonella deserti TaxID=2035528 RepID=A0ABQ1RW55_9SPHN|nr:acyl-homoserine-lactone synthase [Tsuneonella deserti]GGD84405.1 isovaleryl-homoserine lactone synthase [Tsuneonella deserti]
MLHTFSAGARPASDAVLRGMFAARKSVFVDLLKWNVPVIDDAYEVDQFDDAHASYLVLADPDGRHLGSARLLPTARPHILGSFYADLCADGPPCGPAIHEITRFCLDRRLHARERRQVRDTLVTALVEHALAAGIKSYSAIAEMGWFQQILAFGWRCTPLGLPKAIDGAMLAALRIDIDRDTPALLAAAGIVPAASLRAHGRVAA